MRPTVLNARDLPGGAGRSRQLPDGAVWVDRRTKWGNPVRIGDVVPELDVAHFAMNDRPATRDDVITLYRAHLNLRLLADPDLLAELRDATALVCWCTPEACHADVLAERIAIDAEFPGAPLGARLSEEGWLVAGEEAWTAAEWSTRPRENIDDERHRKDRERSRRRHAEGKAAQAGLRRSQAPA